MPEQLLRMAEHHSRIARQRRESDPETCLGLMLLALSLALAALVAAGLVVVT